ncbi:MAG: methyltransferase domain-containing protein [Dehalococcoidales bacterium]|nr:methyltransferase domain-containing protein [Dehalococcoidales bacterium]
MDYKETNKEAWDRQTGRYLGNAGFSNDVLNFGDPRCLTDDDLHLIGDVRNWKILELGCGGANIGINLVKRGATVTGVDISAEQIRFAREEAVKEGASITLEVSSIEDYNITGKYDMVISICAFQYVRHLETVFREVYDHLVPGGVFIFSTDHPAFYAVAYSTIWKDEKENPGYFDESPDIWKWEDEDDYTFITFHHPVEFYVNHLSGCGFRIDRMHELIVPHEEPADEEERLETIFPRYLVVKAVKDK